MLQTAQDPSQRRFDFTRRGTPPAGTAPTGWIRREEAIMGTAISVELWSDDAKSGTAAAAAVMGEMHRIDRRMSPHKASSELSRINQGAGVRPVPCGEEMFRLLTRAQEFAELSRGAFDITYAAVGHLYDYRAGVRPDDATLEAARAAVGWRQLELDVRARTVRFQRPGMRIDLGGFAKGYAVDNAIALLRQLGIRHAYVAAGGDSRVLGDRRGRPWTVAIRDPRRPGEVIAVLPLEDTAISTSGDYERYFDEPGPAGQVTRHHHLIDPATGRSPRDVTSVTILAPDGLTAEALSKSVFVLGPTRGLELLETIPGVDAVIIDSRGRLHATPGLLHAGQAGTPDQQGEHA
ncbi:MAG: FAD:protein FMN transferase [Burkholderiales bacterium]|nr:FAD:protein FMN transferase [Burkholderiales bacterium]